MTMSGSSYILWRITQQLDRLLDLGMEVRTIQSSAKLMYAVGSVDYSMLEVNYIIISKKLSKQLFYFTFVF